MGGGVIPMGIGMMGDAGFFAFGVSATGGLILSGAILALFYQPRNAKATVSP